VLWGLLLLLLLPPGLPLLLLLLLLHGRASSPQFAAGCLWRCAWWLERRHCLVAADCRRMLQDMHACCHCCRPIDMPGSGIQLLLVEQLLQGAVTGYVISCHQICWQTSALLLGSPLAAGRVKGRLLGVVHAHVWQLLQAALLLLSAGLTLAGDPMV
jgi:hypothetical protein